MLFTISKSERLRREERLIELIETDKAQFYRIAYSYVHNEQDALEVIQESVCKAYKSLHKLKSPEYFKTWFIKIVINTAIDMQGERAKVLPFDMGRDEPSSHASSENPDEIKAIELRLDLERAMNRLAQHEQLIVSLRYFEEMKLEEISEIMERPVSTIKSTLYRSLKKLRINLEEAEIQ